MKRIFRSSFKGSPYEIVIGRLKEATNMYVVINGGSDSSSIALSPDDGPEISLTVLKSSGYKENPDLHKSPVDHFGLAMFHLRKGIEVQSKATAAAKEREELEAEALELFKTLMGVKGYENFTWSEVASKDEWLAVARKARELAKGSSDE